MSSISAPAPGMSLTLTSMVDIAVDQAGMSTYSIALGETCTSVKYE
jgi:hypothetical protein